MKFFQKLLMAVAIISSPLSSFAVENITPQLDYCWVNGVIYGLLLPQDLKPAEGLRNNLYIFRNLKGQRPVAEAGPGDINFQKGRYAIVFMDFTPKGVSVLDPDSDGNCEYEITTEKMVKDYEDLGYIKLGSRGALVDYKVVPPELYNTKQVTSNSPGSNMK